MQRLTVFIKILYHSSSIKNYNYIQILNINDDAKLYINFKSLNQTSRGIMVKLFCVIFYKSSLLMLKMQIKMLPDIKENFKGNKVISWCSASSHVGKYIASCVLWVTWQYLFYAALYICLLIFNLLSLLKE